MTSEKEMDNKPDNQLIIMQAIIEANKQDSDEKTKNLTQDLTGMITSTKDQIKMQKSSRENKNSPKAQDTTTVVPDNDKAPPFEGGNSANSGGIWNLKHEISSPKLYEHLIKTELKGDTDLDPKDSYKHINMCLNTATKTREDFLPGYQSIKRHSKFEEYFALDHDHHSYSWKYQTYNFF